VTTDDDLHPDAHPPTGEWAARGACIGLDPALFFPERGMPVDNARAVCRGCEVRQECLDYAIDNSERFGIWGGLSEKERRRMRSIRHRTNGQRSDPLPLPREHGTVRGYRQHLKYRDEACQPCLEALRQSRPRRLTLVPDTRPTNLGELQ